MLSVVRDVALIFRWHGARELAVGVFAIDVAASLGVVALLAVALAQTRGEPRQRFLWISVVPISLALRQYRFVTGFGVFVTSTPAWLSDALVVTAAIVPLAVAYAIVRYRVFDIRVALNRALVLGTIAVLVGCALLVLDWFLSREGVGSSVQLAINIATATIVGFSLNTLQRRLGDRIDAVLFHERYLTRRRYEELERALYSVESRVGLQSLLVAHAPAAFDASSAAFFEQLDDGGYLRTAASNWPPGGAWHILSDPSARACSRNARAAAAHRAGRMVRWSRRRFGKSSGSRRSNPRWRPRRTSHVARPASRWHGPRWLGARIVAASFRSGFRGLRGASAGDVIGKRSRLGRRQTVAGPVRVA
jgi:hypothetical protein